MLVLLIYFLFYFCSIWSVGKDICIRLLSSFFHFSHLYYVLVSHARETRRQGIENGRREQAQKSATPRNYWVTFERVGERYYGKLDTFSRRCYGRRYIYVRRLALHTLPLHFLQGPPLAPRCISNAGWVGGCRQRAGGGLGVVG